MKIFISDDDMCTTQKLNLARVQKWFEANNCLIVETPSAADKVICMTCNGWSLLEQNSYDRINALSDFHSKTIVVGCINDAHPLKVQELFAGPTVRTKTNTTYSFGEIEQYFPEFSIGLTDIPAQTHFRRVEDYRDYNPRRSFINIAEGCSFNCSFCTHKPGLGNLRSRTEDEILKQVEKSLEDDCNIINIMGMETGYYGYDRDTNLAELLFRILNEFPQNFEIQIGQFNPHGLVRDTDKLIEVISNKRVVDMQIPIQSTSTRLLKMMKRPNHKDIVEDFVSTVRNNNPRICFRTDLILGWPTETSDERFESLDFAGRLFNEVATYTIELNPDVPAWRFKDKAFTKEELDEILLNARLYLKKYNVFSHSGQQDDASMEIVEQKRREMREALSLSTVDS